MKAMTIIGVIRFITVTVGEFVRPANLRDDRWEDCPFQPTHFLAVVVGMAPGGASH